MKLRKNKTKGLNMKIFTLPNQAALEIQQRAQQFSSSIEEKKYLEVIKYFLKNLEAFVYMNQTASFKACQKAKITAKEQFTLGVLQENLRKILNQKLQKLKDLLNAPKFQTVVDPDFHHHDLNASQLLSLFDFIKSLTQEKLACLTAHALSDNLAKQFITNKIDPQTKTEYQAREKQVDQIIRKATSLFCLALSGEATVADVLQHYTFKEAPEAFQKLKQQLGENLQYMISNLKRPISPKRLEALDQALVMLADKNASNFSPVAYLAIFKDDPILAASSINTLLNNFAALAPEPQNELRQALATEKPTQQQAAVVKTVIETQSVTKFLLHQKFMGSSNDFSSQSVVNLVNQIPEDEARNKVASFVLAEYKAANDLSLLGRIKNSWNKFIAWMTGQPAKPEYRGRLDDNQQGFLTKPVPSDYTKLEDFKKALENMPQNEKVNCIHSFLKRKKANRELLTSNRGFFRREIMPVLGLSLVKETLQESELIHTRRAGFEETYPDLKNFASLVYLDEAQLLVSKLRESTVTRKAKNTTRSDKVLTAQRMCSVKSPILNLEPSSTQTAAEAPRPTVRAVAG
jgi:hypothetical protein